MADSFIYYAVREEFLRMAGQYEALAREEGADPVSAQASAAD